MHDFRTSTALRQLADLGDDPDRSGWSWAVVTLERSGRLLLPVEARTALDARPGNSVDVSGVCHRDTLVARTNGDGRTMTIDRRGRLYVPAWLRRGDTSSLVVGTRHADRTVVIVATAIFDSIGDVLIGASR